jgi:cell division protein FtsA
MNELITAIDFGTTGIRAITGDISDKKIKILAKAEISISYYNKGSYGDVKNLSRTLTKIFDTVNERLGKEIDKVYINISGQHLKTIKDSAEIKIDKEDRLIQQSDVEELNSIYYKRHENDEWKAIDVISATYAIDEYDGIPDPVGMHSKKLSSEALIALADKNYLRETINALKALAVKPEGIVISSDAVSEILLRNNIKNKVNCIIDCGGKETGIYMMKDKNLLYYDSISLGGYNITKDISYCQEVPEIEAERIKRDKKHTISIPVMPGEIEDYSIIDIIEARTTEIIELIFEKISNTDFFKSIDEVIITGQGISFFKGLTRVSESILGKRIKIDTGKEAGVINPVYLASIGMLKHLANEIHDENEYKTDENEEDKKKNGFLRKILAMSGKN